MAYKPLFAAESDQNKVYKDPSPGSKRERQQKIVDILLSGVLIAGVIAFAIFAVSVVISDIHDLATTTPPPSADLIKAIDLGIDLAKQWPGIRGADAEFIQRAARRDYSQALRELQAVVKDRVSFLMITHDPPANPNKEREAWYRNNISTMYLFHDLPQAKPDQIPTLVYEYQQYRRWISKPNSP